MKKDKIKRAPSKEEKPTASGAFSDWEDDDYYYLLMGGWLDDAGNVAAAANKYKDGD